MNLRIYFATSSLIPVGDETNKGELLLSRDSLTRFQFRSQTPILKMEREATIFELFLSAKTLSRKAICDL